jgi:2-methylisocitrate lyase-like PEP mutase family enzyme
MDHASKTDLFRKLHHGPGILALPNAWDVASARIFEEAGFPAVATSSAGVANSLGYPDGQRITRDEMVDVVRRVAHALNVPVTADMESGYGDALATARAVVDAGAVGMNLEDVTGDDASSQLTIEEMAAIIRKIRSEIDLVINARTDVYLMGIGDPATRFERTVERLNAYHKAGADSLFAPGVRDPDTIGKLARAVDGPLNILATAGAPSIPELEKLGVRRVSIGSGPMRAAMGLMKQIAKELRARGTYSTMTDIAMPFQEANDLFRR